MHIITSYNEIVFPAAILQPPFYNYQADEAVNYGGMEGLSDMKFLMGFDDSGSRYNAEGNLVDGGQQRIQNNFQR
jgi:endothelin-converting enzyme/putative endopeptidase